MKKRILVSMLSFFLFLTVTSHATPISTQEILEELVKVGVKNYEIIPQKFGVKSIELKTMIRQYNRKKYFFEIEGYSKIPVDTDYFTVKEVQEALEEIVEQDQIPLEISRKYKLDFSTIRIWVQHFNFGFYDFKEIKGIKHIVVSYDGQRVDLLANSVEK